MLSNGAHPRAPIVLITSPRACRYFPSPPRNLAYYAALVSEDARDASHVLVLVLGLVAQCSATACFSGDQLDFTSVNATDDLDLSTR